MDVKKGDVDFYQEIFNEDVLENKDLLVWYLCIYRYLNLYSVLYFTK